MYSEGRSSDPFVADQLRKEPFGERDLTDLQAGMVLGKLDALGYDLENVRLVHKRAAKKLEVARREFLELSFHFRLAAFGGIGGAMKSSDERNFNLIKDCMDWKTLWERVNLLYGMECVELPMTGVDDRPYFGFFIGVKPSNPEGLTPKDISQLDRDSGWLLGWEQEKLEPEQPLEIKIQLRDQNAEEVQELSERRGWSLEKAYDYWLVLKAQTRNK